MESDHQPDPWQTPLPAQSDEPVEIDEAVDEQMLPMRRQSFAPKRRPIRVALAWTVIFACTVAIMAMQAKMSSLPPPVPSDTTPGMDMVLFSRMVVGFELVLGQQEADLLAQLEMQADASPFQTTDLMRVAVVIGELYDSDTAKNRLDELNGTQLAPSLEPAANFQTDHQLLRRIYSDEAYVPSSAEANDLILRHGWFGELAATYNLASSDTAYTAARSVASRTIWLIMTFAVLVILAFMAGFVLFITAIILLAMEKIKPKFQPGTLTHNSAYLELVAVFLVAFIALQMLAVWLTPIVGFDLMLPMLGLMVLPVFWPMLCGIRFSQYRKDMGLTAPKGIHREVAAGVVGYLAGLPIVFVGGVLTVLAAMITGMDSEHPAGREILTGGNYEIFVLVLATVVWAPIVEEIVFRAAFYRHLRKLPGWVTWIAATVVTSFIFAAIHPQGIVGIPILMSIAFVLAGLRQWRGSLVAPIAAHALHNGTIITFTITLMYL